MNFENTAVQTDIEIDWHLLVERIGDESLVDEIIPIFIRDNEERVHLLAEAIRKNDSSEIKFYAHSIKGACGIIGAAKLFELCKQLENAARLLETEKYAPLFAQIKQRFENLMSFLHRSDWKQLAKQSLQTQTPQQ